jgi:hypothetical protein
MTPLSPALFLAAASALVASDARVPRPLIEDRIQEFDPMGRDIHRPRDGVTTAAFIAHVGYWSHRRSSGRSAWPFPLDADCDLLAAIGLDRGVVGVGFPKAGDICLRWSRTEQRFVRASIVLWTVEVPATLRMGWSYDCHVLEGSIAVSDPSVATVEWVRRAWVTCCPGLGDRFLSWVDLDERNETTRIGRVA